MRPFSHHAIDGVATASVSAARQNGAAESGSGFEEGSGNGGAQEIAICVEQVISIVGEERISAGSIGEVGTDEGTVAVGASAGQGTGGALGKADGQGTGGALGTAAELGTSEESHGEIDDGVSLGAGTESAGGLGAPMDAAPS